MTSTVIVSHLLTQWSSRTKTQTGYHNIKIHTTNFCRLFLFTQQFPDWFAIPWLFHVFTMWWLPWNQLWYSPRL